MSTKEPNPYTADSVESSLEVISIRLRLTTFWRDLYIWTSYVIKTEEISFTPISPMGNLGIIKPAEKVLLFTKV